MQRRSALLQQALVPARRLRVAYETFWCDDPFHWAQYLDEQTKELRLAPASETEPEGRVTAVLINLLGRPWFSRVWVIQEANIHELAPEVVIGFSSPQLIDFTYTAHYLALMDDFRLKTFGQPAPDYLFPAFQMQHTRFSLAHPAYQKLCPAFQLLVLLSMTSTSYDSSDCRDRIYGLLGLLDKHNALDFIIPDYNKSFLNVIVDTAICLIEYTKSFALLSLAKYDVTDTPSWAPQWNRPVMYARHEVYFDAYFASLTRYSGRDLFSFHISDDKKTLYANGLFIGDVVDACQVPPLEVSENDDFRLVHNVDIPSSFETQVLERPAFKACLHSSPNDGPSIPAHVFEGNRFAWTWENDVQRYDALMQWSTHEDTPSKAKSYYATALSLMVKEDSIFATTDEGINRTLLIPLGDGAKVGDRVALFPGCAWPIQLRPEGDAYRVLGPCYLYGFLSPEEQGHAFQDSVDGGMHWK